MEHMYKICVALVLLASCGTDEPAGPPDDPEFPAPPAGEGIQLVSAVHIEPGEEQLACRYLVLPDGALDVARFQHHYTPGSHHMLLYPTSKLPSEIDDGALFDCRSRGDLGATGVLYGSSVPDGELPYPDGVAMRLAPRSVVLLETHYLNPSDVPLDATARINLWFAQTATEIEAGTLFFRDWAIYLPPIPAEATATMRCELPDGISLLYATSHMHRRGTTFRSTITEPGGEPLVLHDSDSWDSPTPTVYWPPREVTAGSTIEFSCGFRNDANNTVVEGTSADTDEMCVLVGGYWPKLPADAELCLGDGSGPVLAGDRTCEQTVDCMVDAGVDNWVGGQQCVTNTCANSASALSSFVVCVNRFDCWGDPGCVVSRCASQWDACTQATCN
jgi:hypothetical protein